MSAIIAEPPVIAGARAAGAGAAASAASAVHAGAARPGLVFWIVRYLPAEIVGTAALVMAGLTVTIWTDAQALIALAALLGGAVGFYLVLAITLYAEQPVVPPDWRRAVRRTLQLLLAEFGAPELLDTLLIRPAALLVGVWLMPDPLWGLLAGKLFADVVFYGLTARVFTPAPTTELRGGAGPRSQTVP